MSKYLTLSVLLIVTVLLSACSSISVFRYEVLKPAGVSLPDSMFRMLIVDNSVAQPANVGHVVKLEGCNPVDTAFKTASLSEVILNNLMDNLSREDVYSSISCIFRRDWDSEKDEPDAFIKSGKISSEQLKRLSADPDQDVLLSLDRVLMTTRTTALGGSELCLASRDVEVNTVWRMYDLKADTLIAQFQSTDSMFITKEGYYAATEKNMKNAVKGLPEVEKSLPEIASIVAEKIGKEVGPYWEKQSCGFYSSGSYNMNLAGDRLRDGKLEQAAALWQSVYPKAIFRTKYRAAMNMIGYEYISGHLDKASGWLQETEKAMNKCPIGASYLDLEVLEHWKKLIKIRLKDFEKLKISSDNVSNG